MIDTVAVKTAVEKAATTLASLYEHRRRHSPTTEWHNRRQELDSHFVDVADPALAAVPPVLAELEDARTEVINLRAALRREQDARAQLRVENNRMLTKHRADVEGFESALTQEAYEKALCEAENQKLRDERDQARRQLADAMKTIEEGAAADPCGFAVWLVGRGWLVAVERAPVHHDINALTFVDRLPDAARYTTEDEARAALELAAEGEPVTHLSEVGVVVTL